MPDQRIEQDAAEFVEALDLDSLEDGEMEPLVLGGRNIVLARLGSSTYAFDENCTHKRCSLADGEVEDDVVYCPCHGAEFDVSTGEVLVGPATVPLPVHETRVHGGKVLVRLSSSPRAEEAW